MAAGAETAEAACALVERELAAGVAFMNSRGLLHFDAHFENILTDGHRLYFADYGLALSTRFELSPEESAFFEGHRSYDRAYSLSYLVSWLVTELYGHGRDEREAQIRPDTAAALITRHAPLTAVMADFFRRFRDESRETPFPLEELRRLGLPT
jgi:serine/threonine protein kinase